MRIRYTPRARADLESITDYIGERSPSGARKVLHSIRAPIALVQQFPRCGRKQKAHNVRKVLTGKYPYNVYYRIDETENAITVLQVRHAARSTQNEEQKRLATAAERI